MRTYRSRRASRTALGITVGILVALVIFAAATAWAGFLVMVLCGVLWHVFGILKPIGYVPSLGIGFLLSLLGTATRGGNS